MVRPREMSNPRAIALTVPAEMKVHLQKQAAIMGMKEGKPVSVNETIRRALNTVYPTDKQELFEF